MIGRQTARALVFLTAIGTLPACTLSLTILDAGSGDGMVAGVVLRSTSGPVSALQFEIETDPAALQTVYTPGPLLQDSSKTLDSAALSPARTRFVASGMNDAAIPDGVLLRVAISLAPGADPGRLPVGLSSQACTSPAGEEMASTSTAEVGAPPPPGAVPGIAPDGVRNAASMAGGAIAPGSAATLLGADLGPAPEIFFDDYAATVLYASPSQVNVIVPRQARPPGAVLRLFQAGELRAQAAVVLADPAPGIFTADGSGAGAALALNESGRRNSESEPAPQGSSLTVFLTGAGASVRYQASIGGVAVEAVAASEVPGTGGSVVTVRLRLPAGLPDNPRAPLSLAAGGNSAQGGLYVSIGRR